MIFSAIMKVALFFGSFNPIHIGHLIIANHILNNTEAESIWMVVSPQNPFKNKKDLLNQHQRLHIVRTAIEGNHKIQASDVEFQMPQPSYTIDTLTILKERYPQHEFSIIMGSDNLTNFHLWKNYELILKNHKIFVYKRALNFLSPIQHPNIQLLDVPILDISASYIRQCIKEKKSIQYLVPDVVKEEIEKGRYYK